MDLRKALIVDAVVLAVYALTANPSVTGVPVHEWLGVGALVVFVAHTAMHMDWLVDTLRTAVHRRGARIARTLLDAVLVLVFMICCVSGIMVSGSVLQSFGLYAQGYCFWDPLHAASAKLLLALLLVHVVANWRLVAAGLRKRGSEHAE